MPNIRQTVASAVLGILVAVLAVPASAVSASPNKDQTTGTPTPQTVPEDRANSGGSNEPLSDKLDRSDGVIRPPRGVDPGMTQAPPAVGSRSTPIIRPPGAKPGVNPK